MKDMKFESLFLICVSILTALAIVGMGLSEQFTPDAKKCAAACVKTSVESCTPHEIKCRHE